MNDKLFYNPRTDVIAIVRAYKTINYGSGEAFPFANWKLEGFVFVAHL